MNTRVTADFARSRPNPTTPASVFTSAPRAAAISAYFAVTSA